MMIEQFIDRLEKQGLLEKEVIDDLRRKVARSKEKKITLDAIAKYLVDKGHLTQFQATKLVNDITRLAGGPRSGEPARAHDAASQSHDDELTLIPDDAPGSYLSKTRPSAPDPLPQGEATLDDELDDLLNIDDRSEEQKRIDQRRAARHAAEEQAAERQAAERRAAEKRAAERLAAEKKALEQKAAAERAAAERAAAEKAAAEKKALEQKAAAEKAAAERKALEQKAAAERAAAAKAAANNVAEPDVVTTAREGDLVELPPEEPKAPPAAPPPVRPSRSRPLEAPPTRPARAGDDLLADLEASSHLAAAVPRSPVQRKLQKSSEWDSWLLLVGGASLGILLVIGFFLYLSLTRGFAEELLAAAERAYDDEAYSLAVKLYGEFVEDYPRHEKISQARVKAVSAHLRQVYKEPDQGLQVAQQELPGIEQEESFPDIEGELASMLPQIARGFVDQAMSTRDPGVQEQLLAKTQEAMGLVSEYIPTNLIASQQTTIAGIDNDVRSVQREIDRERTLVATIGTINAAVSAGDTQRAYEARQALLDEYPGLDTNSLLHEAVLTISEKEREKVQLIPEPLAAITADVAPAPGRSLIVAHQMGQPVGGVSDRVVYVLAAGSVYALDAATGEVLWRRFVGVETTTHPLPVSGAVGADAIVVDRRRNEIMRLGARQGLVAWRLPVGEPFADPILLEDQLFVAGESGRLLLVEVATGAASRQLQVPQPLEVGPGVAPGRPCFFQPGEQDNLYVISRDTLECEEVYYIGHKRGTIVVPPVLALGYLLVVENAGPDFCYVHVIQCDEQGRNLQASQDKIRLQGQVLVPPVVERRRVLFVTDQRAIELCDVDPNNEGNAITSAGRHSATREDPILSYPLLSGGYMWIANDRFTKYQVQASTGKLPAEWALDEQDVYVGPLQLVGDAMIVHVRRRQGAAGLTVAATRVNDKEPSWQTELAVPIRSTLLQSDGLELVTSRGRLFPVRAESWDRGVENRAASSAMRDERIVLALTDCVPLDPGVNVLTPRADYTQLVFHRAEGENAGLRTLTVTIAADAAALPPTPFAGGLLVPLRDGRVVLADRVTGGDRAAPFHPAIEAGETTDWCRPAVLEEGQEFVIANNHQQLFRVGVAQKPVPHLQQLSAATVSDSVVGPLAALPQVCFAATRSAAGDTLFSFSLPGLEPAESWPLPGRLLWGPQRVGDLVLLATDTALMCVDGQRTQRWSVAWDRGAIVGHTWWADAGQLLIATRGGGLVALDVERGETRVAAELGEPLTGGPVVAGDQVLVCAQSGVLFQLARPRP